jgi:hypothetical protein
MGRNWCHLRKLISTRQIVFINLGVFMKFITVAAFAVGMLSLSSVYAQKTDSVALAQTAATQWLEVVDGGDYAASWDQAGSVFKGMVEKSKWLDAIQGLRSPLGA